MKRLLTDFLRKVPVLRRYWWAPRKVEPSLAALPTASTDLNAARTIPVSLADQELHGDSKRQPFPVAELPGGKVVGDALLATTANDAVLGAIQGLYGAEDSASHWLLQRLRFRRPCRIPGTALLLTAANGSNYFHWLIESLPRWLLLEKAGWNSANVDWILLNETVYPFHRETLDLLGIPAEKRLRCAKGRIFQFDRLIVPAMPSATSGSCPRWAASFLRSTFLPRTPLPDAQRIYVSRRQVRRRRLRNETELEAELQRREFKILVPENVSFQEQAAAFAAARLIVAPHGAGLANLVFTAPGAYVVELFHPEHPNNCYRDLADTLALQYEAIIGTSTQAAPCPDDRQAEFVIDKEQLFRVLPQSMS